MREWGKSHAPTNYLRVRGEYGSTAVVETVHSELPPCARRIHFMNPHAMAGIGTTSACAENTPKEWENRTHHGNYLRVRGEYSTSVFFC